MSSEIKRPTEYVMTIKRYSSSVVSKARDYTSTSPRQLSGDYSQSNHSGIILLVGLIIVVALALFIIANWDTSSLLVSFTLIYRLKDSSVDCIIRGVGFASYNSKGLTYNLKGYDKYIDANRLDSFEICEE